MAHQLRSALGFNRQHLGNGTIQRDTTENTQCYQHDSTSSNGYASSVPSPEADAEWDLQLSRMPAYLLGAQGSSTSAALPTGAPLSRVTLESSQSSITTGTIPRKSARRCVTSRSSTRDAGQDVPDRLGSVPDGDVTTSAAEYKRGGTSFLITVDSSAVAGKEHFIETVLSSWSVVEYCCTEEPFAKGNSTHIHCYLKLSVPKKLVDVRTDIEFLFGTISGTFDVQACRSRKTVLIYITKFDPCPITNCNESSLSFNVRLYRWADRTNKLDYTDPFLVNNWSRIKFIEKYFQSFQAKRVKVHCLSECHLSYNGWAGRVVRWYNKAFRSTQVRKKQLYLFGDTNIGKSTLIEKVLSKKQHVYMPYCSEFGFGGYDSRIHKVILFEEFEWSRWRQFASILKRIVEGRPVTVNVKNRPGMTIIHRGLVIFVSNEFSIGDEALLSRLDVVHADCHIVHCLNVKDENVSPSSSDMEEEPPVFDVETDDETSEIPSSPEVPTP